MIWYFVCTIGGGIIGALIGFLASAAHWRPKVATLEAELEARDTVFGETRDPRGEAFEIL